MTSTRSKPIWGAAQRQAPLFLLIAGGLAGAIFLKDVLDFQTLAENRERLLALRDAITAGSLWGSSWLMRRWLPFLCRARRSPL